MSNLDNLDKASRLCKTGAKQTLNSLLALGPRPDNPTQALLWDQQTTRLQGQLNSLTALVSKLTASAVVAGLNSFSNELVVIGEVSLAAEAKIKKIKEVSALLGRLAKVLDFGLAILAAAAAPSAATIAGALASGEALAESLTD
jgi:hypothetical protein